MPEKALNSLEKPQSLIGTGLVSKTSNIPLRRKIAQMLMLGFDGHKACDNTQIAFEINENHIGGVILFDYNYHTKTYDKNIQTPAQVKSLTKQLQHYAFKTNRPPLFIAIDYEGGQVNRLKADKGFVETYSAEDISKMTDRKARDVFDKMAKQVHELGINLNFAPSVDLAINPDNDVIVKRGRSFSNSPERVTHFAALMGAAFQKQNLLYVLKHFPGHGSSLDDTHHGFVEVTHTWDKSELLPYEQMIKLTNPPAIMSAHVINRQLDETGLPASLSHNMLTGLLRQKLQFDGLIISDDMQMSAINDNFTLNQALIKAINAGVDVLLFGNQLLTRPPSGSVLLDIIEEAITDKKIPIERIDESYERIIRIKKEKLIPCLNN